MRQWRVAIRRLQRNPWAPLSTTAIRSAQKEAYSLMRQTR